MRWSSGRSPEAARLHGASHVLFVDLRDPREREREGTIPQAFPCPRGMLEFWIDPDSPYHSLFSPRTACFSSSAPAVGARHSPPGQRSRWGLRTSATSRADSPLGGSTDCRWRPWWERQRGEWRSDRLALTPGWERWRPRRVRTVGTAHGLDPSRPGPVRFVRMRFAINAHFPVALSARHP